MTSALVPKPDQIDALTRGVVLPLAPIANEFLQVIADGLAEAYREIEKAEPEVVGSASEAEVTALLEAKLNSLINTDPTWRQLVLCVVRGKESVSFNGAHIEKRPDLSIYLTDRNRNFPLIAEAKIIDAANGKTTALYCDKGVQRFLVGEYGWAVREALMVAYVRDGASVAATLSPHFAKSSVYAAKEGPVVVASAHADMAHSLHERNFVYPHQQPPENEPGPIGLVHVWLPSL